MWYLADSDITIAIDYLVDGEFVVPDSATYDVRGHDGVSLLTGSLPAVATSESVTVAAVNNSVGTDSFQNRFVLVTFIYGGSTYQVSKNYGLNTFIPMTASAAKVRSEIGLDASELRDDEVDLIQAYHSLLTKYGSGITTALTASGSANLAVNKAIVLQAAIEIMTSLDLRTQISVRTEDSTVRRSEKIDFDRIADRLQQKLAPLIDEATGAVTFTPTLFGLSDPTDAITG